MTSNTCDGKLVEGIKSISVVTKGTEYVEMGRWIMTEKPLGQMVDCGLEGFDIQLGHQRIEHMARGDETQLCLVLFVLEIPLIGWRPHENIYG